ncbi:MAG: hypothetical protein COB53_05615 [Elusimicrobia bacterium]|nr:MAG: hypothetical protein COB53_05615 [Elusimicrobiota bacterium]
MKLLTFIFTAALVAVPLAQARMIRPEMGADFSNRTEQTQKTPKVEVLFLLDTTGSMGGLIQGAKEKIWSIANEIATGNPRPEIRMGIVAYRDRTDSYITKVIDLNSDIDQVYEELLALQAGGGGDGPEHVLKALADAAQKISWDDDPSAFRVAYLVGDAPAHLDYNDTPGLESLTKALVAKGVILNTIQCGRNGNTTKQWRRIARLGDGHFLSIAQNGGVASIETPFDTEISRLNRELEGTMLGYGAGRRHTEEKMRRSEGIARNAPKSAAAERAIFKAVRGFESRDDLLSALSSGEEEFDEISAADMPAPLKNLSKADQKKKIAAIEKQRKGLRQKIGALSKNRKVFLKKENAKTGKNKDSFDAKLLESLKEQATNKGLSY